MGSFGRWFVFLTVFLCVYGSLHLYVLIKVRRALYLEGLSYIFLLILLAFLMFAPIQARILSSQSYPIFSLVMTWIGYVWMGYIFLFVCLAVPIDTYHLIINALRHLFNADWTDWILSRRLNLALVSFAALGLMVYGAVSAYQVRVERIPLHSAKIPKSVGRMRIVQISDLHLGAMIYPGRLAPILAALREAQPDILVSTGDLIDGPIRNEKEIAQMLNALPAPLGKFAVTGNHEYYAGILRAQAFTQAAGFQMLNAGSVLVKDLIVISGVDDTDVRKEEASTEVNLVAKLPQAKFAVLLKHRPEVTRIAKDHFDLQLSGHTHQGQIFPFSLLIKLFYPVKNGLSRMGKEGHLYLNRGTGTWGPPVRIWAPPEITIFDLLPAEEKNAATP